MKASVHQRSITSFHSKSCPQCPTARKTGQLRLSRSNSQLHMNSRGESTRFRLKYFCCRIGRRMCSVCGQGTLLCCSIESFILMLIGNVRNIENPGLFTFYSEIILAHCFGSSCLSLQKTDHSTCPNYLVFKLKYVVRFCILQLPAVNIMSKLLRPINQLSVIFCSGK